MRAAEMLKAPGIAEIDWAQMLPSVMGLQGLGWQPTTVQHAPSSRLKYPPRE